MHGVYIHTNYIHVNIEGSKYNVPILLCTTCDFYGDSTSAKPSLGKTWVLA